MKTKWTIGALLVILLIAWWALSIYPDWLWFGKLSYSSVFWTMLMSKFGIGVAIWLLLMLLVAINLWFAGRMKALARPRPATSPEGDILAQFGLSGKSAGLLLWALVAVISFIIAQKGAAQWDMVLRFFHQQPFGSNDPLFNRDIGFYVFSLPFYLFLQNGLLVLFVFAGIATIAWYLKNGAIQVTNLSEFAQGQGKPVPAPKIDMDTHAIKHLIFLGGIIALLLAWGYRLKMFNLLYSTSGATFGAGYTDVHVRMPVYTVLIFLSLAFALVLFFNAFKTRTKQIWLSGGIWLALIILLGTLLPVVVQKVIVRPNELTKEAPFIDHNIKYTRQAYNLNKIKEVTFPVADTLTMQDISEDQATIQNIRIWDKRPLLQTYNQLQSIRLYYDFNDVDVDRYFIKNSYRQVMLSARELSVNQLPPQANTWVNRHLIYTHGYGLASSPVNKVTSEGLPDLLIKDLPPSIDIDMKIDHPEIYYGEKTNEYVFVNTQTKEFDYPKGDQNVYTHYQGTGGVPINSFVRRALFALEFFDPQILFTNYLTPESKIMYNRRIDRRVRAIAPFLNYDGDPYLVVSGGRLFWIQDAYTTSNMYPYSTKLSRFFNRRLNYIRNSVKVVIDALDGNVNFYIADEKDPIIKTYVSIFPNLFKPFSKMPKNLKNHVRYPKDLFNVQSDIYRTYHMKDVQVFYNQEDLWQFPDEIYGSNRQKMEPYYIIIRLPREKEEEYVLMLPYTPSKKDNMIAWLAARCDEPNYGNLIVYKLPKEKLVFGPMQIEARIDQQTQISKELTLWSQRGSRVIRGNLLAIPIQDTFIYVEPVYLQAKQSESDTPQPAAPQTRALRRRSAATNTTASGGTMEAAALPELKRIIVSFGNRVVMREGLEDALYEVLGEQPPADSETAAPAPQSLELPTTQASPEAALKHFNRARELLRQGDWAGYGKELRALENILNQLAAKGAEAGG
jgi:uncharacterized membrane protein (UPF0182 family)